MKVSSRGKLAASRHLHTRNAYLLLFLLFHGIYASSRNCNTQRSTTRAPMALCEWENNEYTALHQHNSSTHTAYTSRYTIICLIKSTLVARYAFTNYSVAPLPMLLLLLFWYYYLPTHTNTRARERTVLWIANVNSPSSIPIWVLRATSCVQCIQSQLSHACTRCLPSTQVTVRTRSQQNWKW